MFRNCDIAGCEIQTGDMGTPPNRASLKDNTGKLTAKEVYHLALIMN